MASSSDFLSEFDIVGSGISFWFFTLLMIVILAGALVAAYNIEYGGS